MIIKPLNEDELKNIKPDETINKFINFYILEIEINGELKRFNIEPLLSITNKNLEFLSLEELDSSLEGVSSYRFSILSLKEEINEKLTSLKEDLDKWHGENWETATNLALTRRKKQKDETKATGSWFGSITKEEIKGIYLSSHELFPDYLNKLSLIRKQQKRFNILNELLKILEDRGSQLQTIIKSKQMKKF